jgi:hypothetical protein
MPEDRYQELSQNFAVNLSWRNKKKMHAFNLTQHHEAEHLYICS